MTYVTKRQIAGFLYLPTLICGFGAAMVVLSGGTWEGAFQSFATATVLRLIAGVFMNRMGHSSMIAEWNDRYHRKLVIVLNFGVGAVLLGRLVFDWLARRTHGEELAFFATVIVLNFVIAKFTRPNTQGARVGSAFLTVAIAMVMAWVSWPQHISWITIAAILAFCGAGYRIDQLQRRFDWADR